MKPWQVQCLFITENRWTELYLRKWEGRLLKLILSNANVNPTITLFSVIPNHLSFQKEMVGNQKFSKTGLLKGYIVRKMSFKKVTLCGKILKMLRKQWWWKLTNWKGFSTVLGYHKMNIGRKKHFYYFSYSVIEKGPYIPYLLLY